MVPTEKLPIHFSGFSISRWIWIWRGFPKDTPIPTSLDRNSLVSSVTSWLQHQYEITTIWLYFYIFLFSRKWVVHRASLDRLTIFSKSLVSSRAPGSRVFWGEILTIVVTISMMNNHIFCLQVHLSFPIFLTHKNYLKCILKPFSQFNRSIYKRVMIGVRKVKVKLFCHHLLSIIFKLQKFEKFRFIQSYDGQVEKSAKILPFFHEIINEYGGLIGLSGNDLI